MPHRSLAILLCLLAATRVSAQTADSKSPKLNETAISVAAPGALPGRKIRYAPALGSVFLVKVAFNVSVGREIDAKHREPVHSPEVAITLRIAAVDVPDYGGVTYEAEVVDADVTIRTGVTKDILEQTRACFEATKGTKLGFTIGPRGQFYGSESMLKEVEDSKDDDVAWFVNKQINTFNNVFRQVVLYVPTEDVGPGAKWKVAEPWNVHSDPYVRELDVVWSAADKGEPHIRASIAANWKSSTPVVPENTRTAMYAGLKLSGSLRSTFLPLSPFPADCEFKAVYDWQTVSKNKDGKLEPGKFTDTINIRATTKVEPTKAKGNK